MRRTKTNRQRTPPARIGRCNRELKPKVHTVKGVHTFFMCTLYICPHPAAAPRLACRPHKVHTLTYTFSPLFCVYISVCIKYTRKRNVYIKKSAHPCVCIQALHCCRQNMRKSAHLYVYSKAPVLCVSLPPFFPSSFYFSSKKCTP